MSTNLVMMVLLMLSTILCFMMNSWISIWVMLEINTLSFCSLVKNNTKGESQKNGEMIMKYLIIQSIASALLIMCSSYEKTTHGIIFLLTLLAIVSLMTKSAAAPLHQWFISVTKNMKWITNMILFTWQKLAPLYLLLFQMKKMVYPFILMSAFLGSMSMVNKKSLKEIMAYSSIFNLSWMLLAISISTKIFLTFTLMYWASVIFVTLEMKKNNTNFLEELNEKTNKWMPIMLMANLAGLPPFMGFMAKWMTFSKGLKMNLSTLASLLLIISAVNLYMYLRIVNPGVMKNSNPLQKHGMKMLTSMWTFFLMSNILVLMSVSL